LIIIDKKRKTSKSDISDRNYWSSSNNKSRRIDEEENENENDLSFSSDEEKEKRVHFPVTTRSRNKS
jgi:hypothetical protein